MDDLSPEERLLRHDCVASDPFRRPQQQTISFASSFRSISDAPFGLPTVLSVVSQNQEQIRSSHGVEWTVGGLDAPPPGTAVDDGHGHYLRSGSNARFITTNFSTARIKKKEDLEQHRGMLADALKLNQISRILDFEHPIGSSYRVLAQQNKQTQKESKTYWTGTQWLYLLADHIKLSLLERQRAQSLNLDADTQDGHISRSLDQFRDGLESLDAEVKRLQGAGDESAAQNITDSLPALQKQFSDLTSQFHGFSNPSTSSTTTTPNDPSLSPDFSAVQSTKPLKGSLRGLPGGVAAAAGANNSKTVRFTDSPAPPPEDPNAAALFGEGRYRDDPADTAGYRDQAEGMDNQQIHEYHTQIMRDQDDHLDRLGESIGRQRELSMQIGDELDSHVAMLDEVDGVVDRHQGRLDRARRSLGKVARDAGESKQMMAIIVLIIILVLLIAILK
ncbi:SNARE domain-containing protein [Colletotrichum karsti]|uniref:SNARE domain-containing protein n=1 Tax=Colletotrichum karsti TaxID=1095194 RepID=A0A9P6I933_9PEZI|nr:SNARE domain-containing protein [Colletotrichum karsti]KAF9878494.1 SNARE domain-containing protein [Colletotrichum karsti]